jgi:hypothetical protein
MRAQAIQQGVRYFMGHRIVRRRIDGAGKTIFGLALVKAETDFADTSLS